MFQAPFSSAKLVDLVPKTHSTICHSLEIAEIRRENQENKVKGFTPTIGSGFMIADVPFLNVTQNQLKQRVVEVDV